MVLPRGLLHHLHVDLGDRLFLQDIGEGLLLTPRVPDPLLARFLERIRPLLGGNVRLVVVYGSYARGSFHPGESDVDLFLVAADRRSAEVPVHTAAAELSVEYGSDLTPMIFTPAEVARMRASGNPYLREVARGIPLYGDRRILEA
ncbi:MAG: nucleotidyltransferase domain-containing protein [Euryarchaeota archaeon]|nr:nucleotidyltransferase domain-containing protein [Euryarchaeota archaeon]